MLSAPIPPIRFFAELFEFLRSRQYFWEPLAPERLLDRRRAAGGDDALLRFFALGLDVSPAELEGEGMAPGLAREALEFRPALGRLDELFIPHSHWPAKPGRDYSHLGPESFELARLVRGHRAALAGKAGLDLGSGSGIQALELASVASEMVGIDISAQSVGWARAAALGQGLGNADFLHAPVGSPESHVRVQGRPWDFAVFNPPLAVPSPGESRPHRDGGRLGIEIPLRFLDFASRHLKRSGRVFCLLASPIVGGRSEGIERIDRAAWRIEESLRLHDRFNRSLYRKDRYREQGIERVELWFLRLEKA